MSMNHTEDKMAYANNAVGSLDQAALSAPTAMLRSGFHRPVFHMLAHGLSEGPHTAQLRVGHRQNSLSTGHAVRVLPFGASSHQA
jgi:hypothetical protein